MAKAKKSFLTPLDFRKRFGVSISAYENYIEQGLPTYVCADVIRHPIDEVYSWLNDNKVNLVDRSNWYTAHELCRVLSIQKKTLIQLEKLGLPKFLDKSKVPHAIMYDVIDVMDWLKSQQNNVGECV